MILVEKWAGMCIAVSELLEVKSKVFLASTLLLPHILRFRSDAFDGFSCTVRLIGFNGFISDKCQDTLFFSYQLNCANVLSAPEIQDTFALKHWTNNRWRCRWGKQIAHLLFQKVRKTKYGSNNQQTEMDMHREKSTKFQYECQDFWRTFVRVPFQFLQRVPIVPLCALLCHSTKIAR
jgi:hypothetical protein